MAKKIMAIIVSVCKHCKQVIEIATDESSEDGWWEPPKVGGQVGADKITSVRELRVINSPFLGYIIELDTRVDPHCVIAQRDRTK